LGTVLAVHRASLKGIKRSLIVDLIFWATLASIIGAKVVFILFNGKSGGSGFSSMGAVLAGSIVVLVIAKIKKISIAGLLDILGPPVLLAEGIGRIGCFILHEHLGKTTNFILGLNVLGEIRHDLGLYFSLVGFIGLLFVLILEKMWKKRTAGAIGAVSLFWYFSWRFALEFLLEGSGPFAVAKIYGLTFMQIFSVVMIGFIVFYFFAMYLRRETI
jgi:phosphatidylglycerol:prolipoprotein diacylglycerol transferase